MNLRTISLLIIVFLGRNTCYSEITFDYREQVCVRPAVPGWGFFNTLEMQQQKRIGELHVRQRVHYNHGVLAEGITKVAKYNFDSRGNMTFYGLYKTLDTTRYWETKRYWYSIQNQLVEEVDSGTSGIIYRYKFYYNDQGQRTKTTASAYGKVIAESTYFYDKSARLTEIKRISGKEVVRYLFQYNVHGLLEVLTHYEGKLQREKMSFTYTAENRIDTMKVFRTKGVDTLTDYTVYAYDTAGNTIRIDWYNVSGRWYSANTFEYNSKNEMTFHQYRSDMMSSPQKFEYDSLGLETKEWKVNKPHLWDTLVYDFNGPPETIVLQNVNFETGKSSLMSNSFSELNALARYLLLNPKQLIVISGHTDNVGSELHNQELSEARAKAVRDYIISQGIDSSRVSYSGFGSTQPIAPNDSEEGRKQNRRVEFVLREE